QEVFLQLYRCLGQLASPEHAANWLRRVASHRSMDYSRRRNARRQVSLEEVRRPAEAPRVRDPWLGERLRQLVAALPPKARAVVVLRFQEEMGPEEIAEVLNLPLGTVKSRLQRSLAVLREKIGRVTGAIR
ncbi:MAG: sigma-70 family RNA polymerase sigma factor, partial [Acidobacteria bacterium]|nr:sigma-70 family RNA polymerase sigma factor [Acidobacteriota bacterium]